MLTLSRDQRCRVVHFEEGKVGIDRRSIVPPCKRSAQVENSCLIVGRDRLARCIKLGYAVIVEHRGSNREELEKFSSKVLVWMNIRVFRCSIPCQIKESSHSTI